MVETLSNSRSTGKEPEAVDTHSNQFGQVQGVDNEQKIYQLINFLNLPSLEMQPDRSGSSKRDHLKVRE